MKGLSAASLQVRDRVVELLDKYSDDSGRVECRRALAVAKRLNLDPLVVGRIATEEGYRISQCELGQFGKRIIGDFDTETYELLKEYASEDGKITCRDAYTVARRVGLFKVRATVKKSDLDVVDCQLGCFTEKKKARLRLLLDFSIKSKNSGKILSMEDLRLLRLIKSSKNLCEVVSLTGMSFESLLERVRTIERSLGITCLKGSYDCSEKAQLTDDAIVFLKKFEKLQDEVEKFAIKRFKELFYGDRVYKRKESL